MTARARLADAAWARRDDLPPLVAALGADAVRYVGGCVRDGLLGIESADVDMATRLRPEAVIERLARADIRVIPTGIAHGTVTAVLEAGPVEITTLRHDLKTDGRRAEIGFAQDWAEDAARRDFTINALYAHPETLVVDDWFGGLADLADGTVRFIGDAETRIREDFLRILRFFRFHARFASGAPDGEALAACANLAPSLQGLSRERIGGELMRLLALPDPAPTVQMMAETGVLNVILPEAQTGAPAALAALVATETREAASPDPLRRLAALLPTDPQVAQRVAARLRLSNAHKKRLTRARDPAIQPISPRGLAYRMGREFAEDRLLLAGHGIGSLSGWDIPRLPIKGGDIVRAGIAKGPQVAGVLQTVESRWIAEGFPGEARTREILAEEVSRAKGSA